HAPTDALRAADRVLLIDHRRLPEVDDRRTLCIQTTLHWRRRPGPTSIRPSSRMPAAPSRSSRSIFCPSRGAVGSAIPRAPLDYVVQSLLAAVAALWGAGVLVRVTPAWSEPLVLWQALVGPSSSGKSPALESVRALMGALEPEVAAGTGQASPEARIV